MKLNEKSIEKLIGRIYAAEEAITDNTRNRQETDAEIQARFAKLREARAKKTDAFGNKTYEDAWDNITEEEEEYYRRKSREVDPAVRYQELKAAWWSHSSCWYNRGIRGYDGKGCNAGVCVPECRYFAPNGRVEFEELEEELQKYKEERRREK